MKKVKVFWRIFVLSIFTMIIVYIIIKTPFKTFQHQSSICGDNRQDSIMEVVEDKGYIDMILQKENYMYNINPNSMEYALYKGLRCYSEGKRDSQVLYFTKVEQICKNTLNDETEYNAVSTMLFLYLFKDKPTDAESFLSECLRKDPRNEKLIILKQDMKCIYNDVKKMKKQMMIEQSAK